MKEIGRWGTGVGGPYHAYRYFNCKRGRFKRRDAEDVIRSPGQWTLDTEGGRLRLYVTCPQCGRPNRLSDRYFRGEYISGACVVCSNHSCQVHFFPRLIGWTDKLWGQLDRKVVVRKKVMKRSRPVKPKACPVVNPVVS